MKKTKLSPSGIPVSYNKHIKEVISKIQKGELPSGKELKVALGKSTTKLLELDNEESQLFYNYLGTEAGKFDSNSPVNWSDVQGYIDYYNSDTKYEVGYSGVRPTTVGLKLLEQWYPYTDVDTKKKQVRILRKLQAVSAKIDSLTYKELKSLGFETSKAASKTDFNKLIELAAADKRLDITLSSDVIAGISVGRGTMTVTSEIKLVGAFKGSLGRLLRNEVNKLFNNYTEKNRKDLETLTKSINIAKPFRNNIEKSITATILNKQLKTTRTRKTKKATKSLPGNAVAIALLKNKGKRPKLRKPKVSYIESLFTIRGLINGALSKQVKQNMGKSTDPAVKLRYQTGRFSESAKLISLNRQESGKLMGTYTYMRYPYDVFLPGGRLSPPVERDPRLYIDQSIRQLAISIYKDKYPGVDLELI